MRRFSQPAACLAASEEKKTESRRYGVRGAPTRVWVCASCVMPAHWRSSWFIKGEQIRPGPRHQTLSGLTRFPLGLEPIGNSPPLGVSGPMLNVPISTFFIVCIFFSLIATLLPPSRIPFHIPFWRIAAAGVSACLCTDGAATLGTVVMLASRSLLPCFLVPTNLRNL